MTQNDISYYAAKKSAQDARLKRRETKRHDLAQEGLQHESNVASLIGAEAKQASAQAALQTAATNQKKYELDWEREYGWEYGTDPQEVFSTGNYAYLDDNPDLGAVIPVYSVDGSSYRKYTKVPVTYQNSIYSGKRTLAEIERSKADRVKTIFDTALTGGKTVEVVQEIIEGGK